MSKSTPIKRSLRLLTVDLGLELKRAFEAWCTERGLVPGKVVRGLIERTVAGDAGIAARKTPVPAPRIVVAAMEDHGPKVGREIQLTPSENDAVAAAAAHEGYGFQDFVIAAVRAAVARSPSYGQQQIEALASSNRQLHQVLIELAHCRRAGCPPVTADQLDALASDVRRHVETAALVMAEGAQRWQLQIST